MGRFACQHAPDQGPVLSTAATSRNRKRRPIVVAVTDRAIDWAHLSDAYGTAEAVPGFIAGLRSASPQARASASKSLWGSLCHQGTVYEASNAAVPELAALLADPLTDLHSRVDLALLLGGIAAAYTYASPGDWEPRLPARLHPPDKRVGVDPDDLAEQCRRSVADEYATLRAVVVPRPRPIRASLLYMAAAVADLNQTFAAEIAHLNISDRDPRLR